MGDVELLERYSPILRFNEGEYFLPASVESFVARAELWQRTGRSTAVLRAPAGTLDLSSLCALTRGAETGHFLRLVSTLPSQADVLAWRLRRDRPRFRAETRLGQVGVLARMVDAGGRLSLLLRGRVPAGAEVAAAVLDRDRPDHGDHPYYGRVVRAAGYVVLQYWFFSFFNDWRSRAHGVNDHEGDWEQVSIFLTDEHDDPPEPAWVACSAHDSGGADLRRRWDDPDLTIIDGHPVVHAGLGSHAGAFLAGEYLTSVRGTRLAGVGRAARRVSQLLLPWTREPGRPPGVGIPYVDYKRGDGVSIGAAQPRRWRPVVIDDRTPWVREYTGLWGNDTEDRFGGERGPAGPRYERDGSVRRAWHDPVGWADLDAVAPDETTRTAVVAARIEELEVELATIDDDRELLRRRLRAAALAGATDVTSERAQLADLSRRDARRRDEWRGLHDALAVETVPADPHAHLSHRPVPIPAESRSRRRLLRVWATISTPLLLLLVAVLVASRGRSIVVLAGVGLLLVFAIEAAARNRLVGFLVAVTVFTVGASLAVTIVVALVASWRVTVTIVLVAAAIALLVANLREILRN